VRIDFYVSPSDQLQERLVLVCQLAAKAWQAQLSTFIRCCDLAQAQQLDELLWSFRSASFLPHNLYQDNPQAPIVLAVDEQPIDNDVVFINLAMQIPSPIHHFNRIIEIVCQAPEILQKSRENFMQYRQLGYQPQRVEL
jgi:DNA polymerase-3 subunit chi